MSAPGLGEEIKPVFCVSLGSVRPSPAAGLRTGVVVPGGGTVRGDIDGGLVLQGD